MKILVSGASGLIGTELVGHLSRRGHDVVRLVRREARTGEVRWNPGVEDLSPAVVDGIDAVINLSGAGIGDRRWTPAYKQEILRSRVATTGALACAIAGATRKPSVFLSGSAIGIYGARGDEVLDESSAHGTGFLADVCEKWESAAAGTGVRTVLLRTGIVLSPRGGALKKQLPLFKLGLGGRFGSGKQWQSWISIDDEVRAIEHLLTAPVTGAVNLTAPSPVTSAEFTRTLAKVVKRPALLPIPSFGPKLLLGAELADALLFTGQRVVPNVLTQSGFRFEHSTLDVALRHLLKA
jgi:uncharacterized protein (TIGR01777 family)